LKQIIVLVYAEYLTCNTSYVKKVSPNHLIGQQEMEVM